MKKYAIGFIIGAMVMVSSNAFAAIGDIVEAKLAEFSFIVNGESKTLESPVLVVDGFSYISTRHIADMFGADITYKGDSRTIVIDTPNYQPTPSAEVPTEPTGETPIVTVPTSPNVPPPSGTTGGTPPIVIPTDPVTIPTPIETVAEPVVVDEPEPTSDNSAVCQGIRDSATIEIFNIENSTGMGSDWKIGQVESSRDSSLSAAGC